LIIDPNGSGETIIVGKLTVDTITTYNANEDLIIDPNGSGETIIVGKLTVDTIDPVYEIDGKKYANYVSDFAGGVRTETSGILQLQTINYKLQTEAVIDFDNLETGSDIWLFWETSNKEIADLVVLLTAGFSGNVRYEKQGNVLTIFGDSNGEVSYRLTMPRIDADEWPTLLDK